MKRDDQDSNLDLSNMVCFAIYSTANALTRAYQPILNKLDLTYSQFLVMIVLWEQDDRTVSEIGAQLNLDSGTLTPLLKRLEAAGRIARRRDARDERQVRITLTDEGRELRKQAENIPEQVFCALGQPVDELQDLRARLLGIRGNLANSLNR
ncbi:MarR family transcriptional regulator [Brucella intermedia]|jgi:DNA-binding MarR family transcriptional regulator|uniref:MarR family transcriptional regulator n=2 Tax=Brucella TaxID=234 RepID=A0AA42H5F8_9HYPH|nr:MarR family transcriptional regulator [Brucella intermedia]ERI12099.1 MarR family transcriptional regulator [Ochrobactrum sp. EGD-AQ16]NKC28563.1 MarR family transcriptional regulator [Brucella ciceri]KAB2694940.1 MarR family transcriptional regulator [Brucella intermedia]KAB2709378.1 MarR family transcriptional regulator [Brucella intermedia]MDH0123831.1 MarR family transcriptional regulator [Brucella intermedia GD04153]